MFAGYKGSVSHFVFVLVVACMNCSFAFQPFNLTRLDLDKFQNPTVTKCHDFQGGKEYCAKRLAACDWDRGCCECLCGDYSQSTFDVLAHKCRKNTYFRAGCSWRLIANVQNGHPLKLLDLSAEKKGKLTFPRGKNEKMKSCKIDSINMFSLDGKFNLVHEKVFKVKPNNNRWHVEIKWNAVTKKELHGKIFKVNASCDIERKLDRGQKVSYSLTGCFVFKSSGTVRIVSPILSPSPTTAFSLSKTETSEKTEQPSAHMSTPRFLPASSFRVAQTVAVTSAEPHLVEPTPVMSSPNTLTTTTGFETETSPDVLSPLFPITLPKSTKVFEVPEKITVAVTSAEPHLVEPTPVVSSPNTLTTTTGFETETSPDVVSPLFPITLPKSTKVFEVPEKITTEGQVLKPSSTSNIAETSESYIPVPTAGKQSDRGNKTAIISSAVVICVLIIVGIVLLLLWSQRRKNRTSGQRQSNRGFTNRGSTADKNNAMAMNNHHENIYAEADDVVSSKCVGEKDHYASLDKTIPETEKSDYQPLHTGNTNVYEQILEKKGPAGGPYLVTAPGDKHDKSEASTPAVAEAIYTDLEETSGQVLRSRPADKHDERVYSVLEEDGPGNVANSGQITPSGSRNERDERVYSVLENDNEASTPAVAEAIYTDLDETSGQVLPSRPADKHDEQVYSVLEQDLGPGNESSPAMPDSEYLTVLHAGTSDYEQPFDVPMPDAK